MRPSSSLTIAGVELTLERAKLKQWLRLDEIKSRQLKEAVERYRLAEVAESILEYLSTATSQPLEFWEKLPWFEVVRAFVTVDTLNAPARIIPFLEIRKQIEADHQIYWDYEGRGWFIWLHLFASTYGWGVEYVADLDIDDAIPLMQEILTNEQLTREWEWTRSEVAYPYNQVSKRQEFKSLPRPEWMLPTTESLKIPMIKYKPGMMPVGNVLDLNEGKFDELVRSRQLDD